MRTACEWCEHLRSYSLCMKKLCVCVCACAHMCVLGWEWIGGGYCLLLVSVMDMEDTFSAFSRQGNVLQYTGQPA